MRWSSNDIGVTYLLWKISKIDSIIIILLKEELKYLIQDVPSIILRVRYCSNPTGLMESRTFVEWLKNSLDVSPYV